MYSIDRMDPPRSLVTAVARPAQSLCLVVSPPWLPLKLWTISSGGGESEVRPSTKPSVPTVQDRHHPTAKSVPTKAMQDSGSRRLFGPATNRPQTKKTRAFGSNRTARGVRQPRLSPDAPASPSQLHRKLGVVRPGAQPFSRHTKAQKLCPTHRTPQPGRVRVSRL